MALKFIFGLIIITASLSASAQSEKEKLATIADARANEKQRMIMMKMDSAIALMDLEQYVEADKKFRDVLANIKSVPSDLTYYFGENSYHIGLARQSVDWLNKYIQLKGTSGKFYDDAVLYLKKAEAALITVKAGEVKDAAEILSRNYDIDCGPTGKVLCPVCHGTTVVVKKNYLNETYKTCTHCNKLGYLTCDEYNKLMRGEWKAEGK
jgi:predicted Zn-dependent protease